MNETRAEVISACQEFQYVCQKILVFHDDVDCRTQLSPQHIKRLMAAIEICQVTVNLLVIQAPLTNHFCEICAHICELCAPTCRAMDSNGMGTYAKACARCIQACYAESNYIKQVA